MQTVDFLLTGTLYEPLDQVPGAAVQAAVVLAGRHLGEVVDEQPRMAVDRKRQTGHDTINLSKAQAAAWKRGLVTKPDGPPRRGADSVMGSVRSYYLDPAAWA